MYLLQYGKAAVPRLVEIVQKTKDPALFGRTVDGLAKIGADEAIQPIVERLDDPDSWIAVTAAHALGTIGKADAVAPLLKILKAEPEVASAAAVALGKIGDPKAFDGLRDATTASDPDLRGHAAVALAQLGLPGTEDVIKPLIKDTHPGVRFQAERAFEILKGQK